MAAVTVIPKGHIRTLSMNIRRQLVAWKCGDLEKTGSSKLEASMWKLAGITIQDLGGHSVGVRLLSNECEFKCSRICHQSPAVVTVVKTDSVGDPIHKHSQNKAVFYSSATGMQVTRPLQRWSPSAPTCTFFHETWSKNCKVQTK